MRQIWIPRIGPPEVLELREAPDPTPGPSQVRIRVAASGVNFADLMARMGLYPDAPKLPAVMGYEVAGTVDALGAGVTTHAVGDRVLAFTRFGGYSDVVCAPSDFVSPLPASLSFEKAAAIPVNYITAWLMLAKLGNVSQGDVVLVHAAAGGVGQAALQICLHHGASVIGTASPGKHARLKELGVMHCIDYTTQDFEAEVKRLTGGRGVDIALDAVGGSSFKKSYRSLAPLGRLFMFGASSASSGNKRSIPAALKMLFGMPTFKPIPMMDKNRGAFGVNLGHLWSEAPALRNAMTELLRLVERGVLDPIVDRAVPFARAAEAHAALHDRKNFGKVVLVP